MPYPEETNKISNEPRVAQSTKIIKNGAISNNPKENSESGKFIKDASTTDTTEITGQINNGTKKENTVNTNVDLAPTINEISPMNSIENFAPGPDNQSRINNNTGPPQEVARVDPQSCQIYADDILAFCLKNEVTKFYFDKNFIAK